MAIGIRNKADRVAKPVSIDFTIGIVVPAVRGRPAGVKNLNDGTSRAGSGRIHVKVGVAANLQEDEIRLLGHYGNRSGEVNPRRHAPDDRLLIADRPSVWVIVPAPSCRLTRRIQSSAVWCQCQPVVELARRDKHGGAVDATVRAEGMHRDAPAGLSHQHVALGVKDDGADLPQIPGDLESSPTVRGGVLEPEVASAIAASGTWEPRRLGIDACAGQ